jgi:hypothetical protein
MSPVGVLFFSTRAKSFLLTPASTIWMQCLSDDTITITLSYLITPQKKQKCTQNVGQKPQ